MKKIGSIVLILLLSVGMLAACGEKTPDPSTEPEVKEISGVIDEASSMSDLYLSDATGKIYLFSLEGVTVEGDGIAAGNEVTVSYVGELQDTDAVQSVEVKKVVTVLKAENPDGGTDSQLPADGEKEFAGVVEEGTNSDILFVTDATGVIYQFSLEGVVVDSADGTLNPGDAVNVYYTGEIIPTDELQTNAVVIKVEVTD